MTPTPVFTDSLDADRPHTLLTDNPRFSGSLVYRYDDTGEQVSVPNVWYNQTVTSRVSAVRWEASRHDERAEQLRRSPPCGLSERSVADLVRRHRERADRIRAEAERMEAAADIVRPVAAARMQLDYGPVC